MNCEELRNFQDLYLDRELGTPEAATIEAHLLICGTCRGAIAGARALKAAIRGTARRYTAPLDLEQRIRREIGARRSNPLGSFRALSQGWNPIAIAASLLLTIATSSSLTATYLSGTTDEHVVQDVVASHVRSLMANHLTDVASSDQHTVKPWFSGKIDNSPPAIDLASAGFPLIGGRLDYVADHPCAALVYRHDKHVINVLVWARDGSDTDTAESYSRQGYNIVHFTENNLDYWAVSDLNHGELADFVNRLEQAARTPDA